MPPTNATTSSVRHRVPFYETDAMGVVHHSNYVRYLELARIVFLDEHDRPYTEYMQEGLHFTTTRVEVEYRRATGYDDVIEVTAWIARAGFASLRMEYELCCDGELVAVAATEHAMVNGAGRIRRIPRAQRENLRRLTVASHPACDPG